MIAGLRATHRTADVPPFLAVFAPSAQPDEANLALVIAPPPADLGPAVAELRRLFTEARRPLSIEYNDALWPDLAAGLEACGLAPAGSNPLLACGPRDFLPAIVEGISIRLLTGDEGDATLRAFQEIRWTDGNLAMNPDGAAIERLRGRVRAGRGRYYLASIDGQPVGTGVLHQSGAAGEVVGIVTRASHRRRGVAAAVTSAVTSDLFARGGRLAFMDVANEGAGRVYERLGYRRFGNLRTYSDPGQAAGSASSAAGWPPPP